jgi:hypothetical protein
MYQIFLTPFLDPFPCCPLTLKGHRLHCDMSPSLCTISDRIEQTESLLALHRCCLSHPDDQRPHHLTRIWTAAALSCPRRALLSPCFSLHWLPPHPFLPSSSLQEATTATGGHRTPSCRGLPPPHRCPTSMMEPRPTCMPGVSPTSPHPFSMSRATVGPLQHQRRPHHHTISMGGAHASDAHGMCRAIGS